MYTKKIHIDNFAKPISLEYSNNDTFFGDTAVTIYDDYKISLVLTDNCGAVTGDNLIFPKRGDIVIFRPNEVHFGRFPDRCEYKFLSFLIPVDFFDHFFAASKNIIAELIPITVCIISPIPLLLSNGDYYIRVLIAAAHSLTKYRTL